MSERFDGSRPVLVIGAGPVGQTAALCLARWGVPVVMLDARPARDPIGSKALCQQRDVLDLWDACGAGSIASEGLTWSDARTFYQDKELFCWRIPDPGRSPVPPFVNVDVASLSRSQRCASRLERKIFDLLLPACLRTCANIDARS